MDDLDDWIRLTKTGASARRLNRLLDHFGSPGAIFDASPEQIASVGGGSAEGGRKLLNPDYCANARDRSLMEKLNARLLPRTDPAFPALLREIPDPPVALYIRGEIKEVDAKAVAIVGSRQATDYGKRIAERLARELAEAGVTVVSGLARGADTAAHLGAMRVGGRTIACLGCGVDICYPAENRDMAAAIPRSGALVSEYPMNAPPDAWHFPSRNRLVSGLSLGVLLIEAPLKSGAMITAACAVEQNREVFAVPGNIENFRNAGPHSLIKDGAKLVDCVEDILDELRLRESQPKLPLDLEAASGPRPAPNLVGDEATVYAQLSEEPLPVDDIILETGLPAQAVSGALVMLEMKGVARRLPGNAYVRL